MIPTTRASIAAFSGLPHEPIIENSLSLSSPDRSQGIRTRKFHPPATCGDAGKRCWTGSSGTARAVAFAVLLLQCMSPLLAQSRHSDWRNECPLLGGKADIEWTLGFSITPSFWDGILLAAAFVGVAANLYKVKSWEFGTLVGSSIISMILSLFVVSVDWKFLGYVRRTPEGNYDFNGEIEMLRKVRRFRESVYRWAWFFAFLSAADFAVIIGLRILE
jgi:hypothetical protein